MLWFLTAKLGAGAVRLSLLNELNWPADIPEQYKADKPNEFNFRYSCYSYSRAIAPFLVRVSYGKQYAPVGGEGRERIYFWVFGKSILLSDKTEWNS